MFRLRSYETNPPGGYPFEQAGSPGRIFRAEPMLEAQARNVQAFRKGNGLARSSYAECIQDVDTYTCARLGNNPQYCLECEQPGMALAANAPGLTPCAGCGAKVD